MTTAPVETTDRDLTDLTDSELARVEAIADARAAKHARRLAETEGRIVRQFDDNPLGGFRGALVMLRALVDDEHTSLSNARRVSIDDLLAEYDARVDTHAEARLAAEVARAESLRRVKARTDARMAELLIEADRRDHKPCQHVSRAGARTDLSGVAAVAGRHLHAV